MYNSCTVVLFNTHEQTFTKRLKNEKYNNYERGTNMDRSFHG